MMDMPQDLKEYIDLDEGLGRIRGNKMIYGKMLGMFTGSEEFAKLEDALCGGNNEQIADVAHAIKGMAGNLGFTRLFNVSAELMVTARQGTPGDDLVAGYREALQKTLDYIPVVEEQLKG